MLTGVCRNDELSLAEIERLSPSHIIISPGPGVPDEAGISLSVIHAFFNRVPILGVCLGHQAIGQAFGGCVVKAQRPLHGRGSWIKHIEKDIFSNLPSPLFAGRYHSLIVDGATLPEELEPMAWSEEGELMGLRHKQYPVYGVQFHPESILTQEGHRLLANFLFSSVSVSTVI